MTAPQAPAAEKAPEPRIAAPAVSEPTEAAPIGDLAAISGVGARASLAAAQHPPNDPRRLIALQRAVGNGTVTRLLQRSPQADAPPTTDTPAPIQAPAADKPDPSDQLLYPVYVEDLKKSISDMPSLIEGIKGGRYKHVKGARFAHGVNEEEARFVGSIAVAKIVIRDAVYLFDGKGKLLEVELNLTGPVDRKNLDNMPPSKYPVLPESATLVAEPATKRVWQVFYKPATNKFSMEPFLGKLVEPPGGFGSGDLILLAYNPWITQVEEGGPAPGFKAKEEKKEAPDWAAAQVDRVQRALKRSRKETKPGPAPDTTTEAPTAKVDEPKGTGAGLAGQGPGGGGTDPAGAGTGTTGAGKGAAVTEEGKGRGADKTKADPKTPDKIGLWMGKHGPMLNVWKDGSHEAILIKEGESDESLKGRIEAASARQVSTGERLAGGATETAIVGGGEGHAASPEDIAGATEFTANAASYPSTIEMQGGSGADVSPNGWATTISGAKHNFDMILDWDARHSGLANQVFARLGFVDYYWQVIDISKLDFGEAGSAKGQYETQGAFSQRMKKQAVAGTQKSENVREATEFEGFKETVSDVASNKWEDAKADMPDVLAADSLATWPAKAQQISLIALDAAWSIGKALISAWVTKMTEPENRREIAFGQPGEFLVRCLANPQPNDDVPYDKQTRRATSVAVFAVRVANINDRAKEVTREDKNQLEQAQALVADLQKKLALDPTNEGLKSALEIANYALTSQSQSYGWSTVEKVGHELEGYDKQIAVLEKLKEPKSSLADLSGEEIPIGLQLREDIAKRLKRGPNGFVAWYDYEFHLYDIKEARKKKAEQKELTEKKAESVASGTELRPRVTFVSEENGALVRMDMILGRAKGSSDQQSKWVLADVTTPDTARSYDASSEKSGTEGDHEAVTKAFEEFCEKAEYGRGTIAIEIPSRADLVAPGTTMLMKPGASMRWRGRLQSLIEVAGLVAPYVPGGALIARLAAIGGALDAGARLYDRAVNDRLKANFETLADVVAVLTPLGEGAGALASRLSPSSTGGFMLQTFGKSIGYANQYMMPATFVHDLDKILKDTSLGGPEKKAAIAMLFGRGLRDGVVQYVRIGGPPGPPLETGATARPGGYEPTGGTAIGRPHEVGVPHEVGGPIDPTARPAPGGPMAVEPAPIGPAQRQPTTTGQTSIVGEGQRPTTDVHGRFDVSDVKPAGQTPKPPVGQETTVRREPPRPAHTERPPRGTDDGPPPDNVAAKDLGIDPNSPLNTPRGRENRAEQLKRAAAWQVDAATIEHGTRPDARARARAADFTPMFAQWQSLGTAGRQGRIRDVINGHLAREGIPPVKVEFGPKPAGHAQFDASSWTITLSADVVNANKTTPELFASFVDNAVHETQHTVTTYRGVRIALSEASFHPQAHIPGKVLGEAIAANKRRHPAKEFDEVARKEAMEIYQTQVEPRAVGEAPPPGIVDREAVYARKKAADTRLADANTLHNFNVDEARQNPHDPQLQRNVAESGAALQQAAREQVAAHNDYVALPEEVVSWRAGSAVKEAVLERLALEARLVDARKQAATAGREQRQRRGKGDVKGAADALKRSIDAQRVARETRQQIAALTSKDPSLVGGQLVRRTTPLTEPEIAGAPQAPAGGQLEPGETQRRVAGSSGAGGGPGSGGAPGTGGAPGQPVPRGAESSPAPGGPGAPGGGGPGRGGPGGGGPGAPGGGGPGAPTGGGPGAPGGGSRRTSGGGSNEPPLPADTDVEGAVERGFSEVDADRRPYTGAGAPVRRPNLTDVEAATSGQTTAAQNVRADAATSGQISINLPHPAAADAARARLRTGTGTPADALTIIQQSVGVARAYASGVLGGPQNLNGDTLAGLCMTARDVTALSLATQLQDTGVASTVRRYSVNGLAGRTTGAMHQFTVVEFRFPDRTERYIIDPTYAQFVDPGGTPQRGGPADRARASTGSAETMTRLLEDGYIPLTNTTARVYLDSLVPPNQERIDPARLTSGAGGIDVQGRGPSPHIEAGPKAPTLATRLEDLPYVEVQSSDFRRASDGLRAMGRSDLAHEIDELGAALQVHGIDNPRPFSADEFEKAGRGRGGGGSTGSGGGSNGSGGAPSPSPSPSPPPVSDKSTSGGQGGPAASPRSGPTTFAGDEFPEDQPATPKPVKVGDRELRRGPGAVGPGQYGAVDEVGRLGPTKKGKPVPDFVVEARFRNSPDKVIRSPSIEWHEQMWNATRPSKGFSDVPPPAFEAEGVIAVAPDYPGQATDLPNIGPATISGLGQPLTGSAKAGTKPPTPEGPAGGERQDPLKDAYARGPIGRPMPRAGRRQVAQPISADEVRAVFASNPQKVMRSPDMGFHLDGYRADGGEGKLPDAYRVGDIVILGPRYPVAGVDVPKLAVPGSAGAAGTGAAPDQPARPVASNQSGAPLAAGTPQRPTTGRTSRADTFDDEITQTDIRPPGARGGAGPPGSGTTTGTTGTGTGTTAGTTTGATTGATTGGATPTTPPPTVRPPWVPPRPDTLEAHPDSPHHNIIVEKGMTFDIDRMLDTLDRTAGGGRIADRLRDGSLRMTFVRSLSTGDAGLHFAGGEVYVTWRGSMDETVSTITHEGSHRLDPAAQVLGQPRGPSRLGVEAEARAFEYEHRQDAKLPVYDKAEQAYRDAYDKVLKDSRQYKALRRTSSRDRVITEKDLPEGVVREARIAADKAMIQAMRADPTRYAVESADDEKARIESRRPASLRTKGTTPTGGTGTPSPSPQPAPAPKPTGSEPVAGPDQPAGTPPVVIPTNPKARATALQDPKTGPAVTKAIEAQNEVDRQENAAKAAGTISPGPVPSAPKATTRAKVVPAGTTGTGAEVQVMREIDTGDGGTKARGGSFTILGDDPLAIGGQSTTTKPTGSGTSTATTTGGSAALTKEGKFRVGGQQTVETTHGVDESGNPIKSSKGANAAVEFSPDGGFNATGGVQATNKGGTTGALQGGVAFDANGNPTLTGGASVTGKSGSSARVTVSSGTGIDVSEIVEVDGQFEVAYSVTDTTSLGAGGEAKMSTGGPGIGGGIGTTSSSGTGGTRRFKTKKEAEEFKKNARMILLMDKSSSAPKAAADALKIPIGESRQSTSGEGSNWGVSVSYGASVGYGEQESTTHQLSVRHVDEFVVDVTATVAKDKVKDWSISGGLTDVKGGTDSESYAVVYRFNLKEKPGRDAYELFTQMGIPLLPEAQSRGAKAIKTKEEHDKISLLDLSNVYSESVSETRTEDESGVQQDFTGQKGQTVKAGFIARNIFGDKDLHSNASVTGTMKNGKVTGYQALVTVGGESGAYNREQLGQIFMGAQAKPGVDVKRSGEWTLSAQISEEVVKDLEANSTRFQNARYPADKMRVLSEIIKENGARAAGGLVRTGGNKLAWDLELKGDPNFPGNAGREALAAQREQMSAALKTGPDAATKVVHDVQEVLAKLNARKKAIKEEKNYTDLPDELRAQQVALVDRHIYEFNIVRSNALMAASRRDAKETIADIRARLANPEGYKDVKPEQLEIAQFQDKVADRDVAISEIKPQILTARDAIAKAERSFKSSTDSKKYGKYRAEYKASWREAEAQHKQQIELANKAQELRAQTFNATDPQARVEAWRKLYETVALRYELLELQMTKLKDAGAALVPITSDTSRQDRRFDEFWAPLEESADEDEAAEAPVTPNYTAMALEK